MVEGEERRADGVAAEERAEGERCPVPLGGPLVEGLGDEAHAAQRRHRRDGIRQGRVERLAAVRERVHGARAHRLLRLGRHRVRVGKDELRANEPRGLPAGGQAVERGHRRPREGRRRRGDAGAADRADRLRDVDHPAATEGKEPLPRHPVDELGRHLVHRSGANVVRSAGQVEQRGRRCREGPLAPQELDLIPPLFTQQARRPLERPAPEDDRPLAVSPGELAPEVGLQEPAPGFEPGRSRLQIECST